MLISGQCGRGVCVGGGGPVAVALYNDDQI